LGLIGVCNWVFNPVSHLGLNPEIKRCVRNHVDLWHHRETAFVLEQSDGGTACIPSEESEHQIAQNDGFLLPDPKSKRIQRSHCHIETTCGISLSNVLSQVQNTKKIRVTYPYPKASPLSQKNSYHMASNYRKKQPVFRVTNDVVSAESIKERHHLSRSRSFAPLPNGACSTGRETHCISRNLRHKWRCSEVLPIQACQP
jgi:hypothetical protein